MARPHADTLARPESAAAAVSACPSSAFDGLAAWSAATTALERLYHVYAADPSAWPVSEVKLAAQRYLGALSLAQSIVVLRSRAELIDELPLAPRASSDAPAPPRARFSMSWDEPMIDLTRRQNAWSRFSAPIGRGRSTATLRTGRLSSLVAAEDKAMHEMHTIWHQDRQSDKRRLDSWHGQTRARERERGHRRGRTGMDVRRCCRSAMPFVDCCCGERRP